MVQDEPSSPASSADHSSPPSRLLSKHRPRRRAAAPRPPLPPPPPPPALTRGQPDLTLCHCCDVRFPPPQPGSKRRPVRPLSSLWRVVLLCAECLSLVRSAAICSYCLSLDNLPPADSAVACRRCKRCVHQSCIPAEHRAAPIQPVDVENFLCVDCCPTLRPKNGGSSLGLNLEAHAKDPTLVAGANALRKVMSVKSASKPGKDVLALAGIGGGGSDGRGSGDPALLDEELALQLHIAMNGSQRISRSGNSSGGGSDKWKKDVVGERMDNGDQEICVTNMMAQLDDESEPGCDFVSKRIRRLDPSVTVVLALECVKGKRTQDRMKAKRKDPPPAKQQDDSEDRYKKKYSKRTSSKQPKVENIACGMMHDGKDMDRDHGGNSAVPVK